MRVSRHGLLAPAASIAGLPAWHAMLVDRTPWLFDAYDLNPGAMSKKATGFRPAQS
jgi:hypothetical protein